MPAPFVHTAVSEPSERFALKPVLQTNQAPPPDYYRNNLLRVVNGVERTYGDLLDEEERLFVERFRALSRPAQRLYARLIGRKSGAILLRRIRYPEVERLTQVLLELAEVEFIQLNGDLPADQVLAQLTLAEMARVFPAATALKGKQNRINHTVSRLPDRECLRRVCLQHSWLNRCNDEVLKKFLLFFFGAGAGDREQDFAIFVMQDLGVLHFESYPFSRHNRLFNTRSEVDDYLFLRTCSRYIHVLAHHWNAAFARLLQARLQQGYPHRLLQQLRDRRLCELGRAAERACDCACALTCYETTERAPARERRARIMYAAGRREACRKQLLSIARCSSNPAEVFFACSFARRKKLDLGHGLTSWRVPPEQQLTLPSAPQHRLEDAVLRWLTQQGDRCWYLENRFSLGLFGLALWDIVFADVNGVFVNAYQTAPLDLFWPDFVQHRKRLIGQRLADFTTPGVLEKTVLNTLQSKWGTANQLVSWRELDREMFERMFRAIPVCHLLSILKCMLGNLAYQRRGFPDLLLLKEQGGYEFLEVKGPGDRLSMEQRSWFDVFSREGISAAVLKVSW